jgi:hypothetical protein
MKIISYIVFSLICITLNINAFAETTIIKWVDKDGVTHYGDKKPMPNESQRSRELNKEGVTKRVNNQLDRTSSETEKENIEQARRDAALLASYSSEKEIDIAQERNTRIDEIALGTLNQKHDDLMSRLAKNSAAQAFFKDKKKPIPENINRERQDILSEIKQTEQKIKEKESEIEATRQRYADDKSRYAELKAKGVSYKDLKVR